MGGGRALELGILFLFIGVLLPSVAAVPFGCGDAATSYSADQVDYGSRSFCGKGFPSPWAPGFPASGGSSTWTCNAVLNNNIAHAAVKTGMVEFNGDLYYSWTEMGGNNARQVRVAKWDGTTLHYIDGGSLNVNPLYDTRVTRITVFNNQIVVLWSEKYNSVSRVYAKTYDGSSWMIIPGDTTRDYLNVQQWGEWVGEPAVFNGRLYVAWQEANEADSTAMIIRAKSTDGTSTFLNAGTINIDNWAEQTPSLKVWNDGGGDDLYLAYNAERGSISYARAMRYNPSTRTWTSIQPDINAPSVEFSGGHPQLEVLDNKLYMIYGGGKIKRYVSGASWTSPLGGYDQRYDTSKTGFGGDSIVYNGNLYMIWQEATSFPFAGKIRAKRWDGVSATWTTYPVLNDNPSWNRGKGNGLFPSIVTFNGDVYVTFSEHERDPQEETNFLDGNWILKFKKLSGTSWVNAWTKSCSATRASGPAFPTENIIECGTANQTYTSPPSYSYGTDTFCAEGEALPQTPAFPALGGTSLWDCFRILNANDENSDLPLLHTHNDVLYIAWSEPNSAGIKQLHVATWDGAALTRIDGGDPETGLNYDLTRHTAYVRMLSYGGGLYIFWSEEQPSSGGCAGGCVFEDYLASRVYVKKFNGYGWTFVNGGIVDPMLNLGKTYYGGERTWAEHPGTPALYASKAWFAWQEIPDGRDLVSMLIRVANFDGTRWTYSDNGLDTASDPDRTPNLAKNDGVLYVTYGRDQFSRIRVAKYAPASMGWSQVLTSVITGGYPGITSFNNVLYLYYADTDGRPHLLKHTPPYGWDSISNSMLYDSSKKAVIVRGAVAANNLWLSWHEGNLPTNSGLARVKAYTGSGWVNYNQPPFTAPLNDHPEWNFNKGHASIPSVASIGSDVYFAFTELDHNYNSNKYLFDPTNYVKLKKLSGNSWVPADSVSCMAARVDCASQPEVCNGEDDNCNGQIDEGVTTTYYYDFDDDTYGTASSEQHCAPGSGHYTATQSGDCDDTDAAVHPGAVEVCNGIDDNCVNGIDEGVLNTYYRDADLDGYGDPSLTAQACGVSAGYVANSDDCDDTDGTIHPGAAEVCDLIDNDCNAATADGSSETWLGQACDGADTDACDEGVYYCSGTGTQECSDATGNNVEICNGIDDDCQDGVDTGCDNDNDDYCDCAMTRASPYSCSGGSYCCPLGGNDCDDVNAGIHPGAVDTTCDSIDQDCSGGCMGNDPAEPQVCTTTLTLDVDGHLYPPTAGTITADACTADVTAICADDDLSPPLPVYYSLGKLTSCSHTGGNNYDCGSVGAGSYRVSCDGTVSKEQSFGVQIDADLCGTECAALGGTIISPWPASAEGSPDCCGNDIGENYLQRVTYGNVHNWPLSSPSSTFTCCDFVTDCVGPAQECFADSTRDPSDVTMVCDDNGWYECGDQNLCGVRDAWVCTKDAASWKWIDGGLGSEGLLCGDGIDNDCDGKIDEEDPDCALTLEFVPDHADGGQTVNVLFGAADGSLPAGTRRLCDNNGCNPSTGQCAVALADPSCETTSDACSFTASMGDAQYGYWFCFDVNNVSGVLPVGMTCTQQGVGQCDYNEGAIYWSSIEDAGTTLRYLTPDWECDTTAGKCSDAMLPAADAGGSPWTCDATMAKAGPPAGACGYQWLDDIPPLGDQEKYVCYKEISVDDYNWVKKTDITWDEDTQIACEDGFDNDCDGFADCADASCDGFDCPSGVCRYGDCCIPDVEICDGVDNNCDGQTDEGCLGNLTITVVDAEDISEKIKGANVRVARLEFMDEGLTGADGKYVFEDLTTLDYSVTVSASGHDLVVQPVQVFPGENALTLYLPLLSCTQQCTDGSALCNPQCEGQNGCELSALIAADNPELVDDVWDRCEGVPHGHIRSIPGSEYYVVCCGDPSTEGLGEGSGNSPLYTPENIPAEAKGCADNSPIFSRAVDERGRLVMMNVMTWNGDDCD